MLSSLELLKRLDIVIVKAARLPEWKNVPQSILSGIIVIIVIIIEGNQQGYKAILIDGDTLDHVCLHGRSWKIIKLIK